MNVLSTQPPGSLLKDLLHYWIRHPEAFGTEEAIVEWWLLEQHIHRTVVELKSVLETLVANGLVVQRKEADGRTFYRLNRAKEEEIVAWLRSE